MFGILLALLILDGILLTIVVLLQAGKGGGLAAMGGAGTDTFIGGRQAATILTKASWIGGGIFMALAFVLAIMSTRAQRPQSILREELQRTAPAIPQPILPTQQPDQQEQSGGASTAEQPAPSAPSEQPPEQP